MPLHTFGLCLAINGVDARRQATSGMLSRDLFALGYQHWIITRRAFSADCSSRRRAGAAFPSDWWVVYGGTRFALFENGYLLWSPISLDSSASAVPYDLSSRPTTIGSGVFRVFIVLDQDVCRIAGSTTGPLPGKLPMQNTRFRIFGLSHAPSALWARLQHLSTLTLPAEVFAGRICIPAASRHDSFSFGESIDST
jgi:hypothetical protein